MLKRAIYVAHIGEITALTTALTTALGNTVRQNPVLPGTRALTARAASL